MALRFSRAAPWVLACTALAGVLAQVQAGAQLEPLRPNVILMMADDLGWGDAGYQGRTRVRTPEIDALAFRGLRFQRFYAAAPVCSPTRFSVLTGRHPHRAGIWTANSGHLPAAEVTLAEALRDAGYVTGHFGKWHLGTLTRRTRDSNRGGPNGAAHYAPPWEHGFDTCFSTEAQIPLWDPMKDQVVSPTAYWTGEEQAATDNLEGDDSRVIMDRVIPFVLEAKRRKRPFLAVVWFHTPHSPVRAGEAYRSRYADLPRARQDYYGAITAMDEQLGRLRKELESEGLLDNTQWWFCSDNGATGEGSTGGLRGRKGTLWEGGVRVPAWLVWPARIRRPRTVDTPCVTTDLAPTVLDTLGIRARDQLRPLDGISLRPLIEERMLQRPEPIPFDYRGNLALIEERYKLLYTSAEGGTGLMLFDLLRDPAEKRDLAGTEPAVVRRMALRLDAWRHSCAESFRRSGASGEWRSAPTDRSVLELPRSSGQ